MRAAFAVVAGVLAVDPVATESSATELARLTASHPVHMENFGADVAIDGTVVVCGAPGRENVGLLDAGVAYVYERDAGGSEAWGATAKLTASNPGPLDDFGGTVDVDGDTIAVGAFCADGTAGAVYIFERGAGAAGGWGETIKIPSPLPAQNGFGADVAIDGDVLVVGVPGHDLGGPGEGAVYVFERDRGGPGAWGLVATLVDDQAFAGDRYGAAVAVSGNLVVVGAYLSNAIVPDAGAAFVYARNAGGANAWGEVDRLFAPDAALGDNFGRSVAVERGTVVVGAWLKSPFQAGAAYVFERRDSDGSPWEATAKLTAEGGTGADRLGNSVAIDGGRILVGAAEDDYHGYSNAGSVYLFERRAGSGGAWSQVLRVVPEIPGSQHEFGIAVDIAGDRVIVGEHQAFHSGLQMPGEAHVYALQ